MTETDFFTAITAGATTKEEKIVKVLQARGFLIHLEDGKYYLSDNATQGDVDYLSKGFITYSLGKIASIQRKGALAEVLVSTDAEINDAILFFNEKRVVSYPITNQKQPWGKLKNHKYGEKVDVQGLEPYVARYVKAVSACGVATNYSCDGNDEGQRCVKVNAAKPFNIWHKMICKYIIPSEQIEFREQMRVNFSLETRFETYLFVNRAAAYLYDHRLKIREIKAKACKKVTASQIKHLSDHKIKSLFESSFLAELKSNPICW